MPKITGEIRDAATGEIVQARVQVLSPQGVNVAPADAMWKVGSGEPFFYSDGQFSLETTRGYHRVLVERGTEFTPWEGTIEVDGSGGVSPAGVPSSTGARSSMYPRMPCINARGESGLPDA